MKKFEVDKIYECRSMCDRNCVWTYEVIKRTAKSIQIKEVRDNEVKMVRIKEIDGGEFVKPLGSYSMAPILRAV